MQIKTMKEKRVSLHMTQQQTADALDVSLSTVNRLETGRMRASIEMHRKINDLFKETVAVNKGTGKLRGRPHNNPNESGKVIITPNEKRFLKTCWNMREALYTQRMITRDLVDATFEFMESCEAITYLYKWSKIGFYHYPQGAVVDQGYFLWDKLPPKYRRILSQNE